MGFHPIRIKATHHFILLKNQFGLIIRGSHPEITENTGSFKTISLTQFEDLENIGVEYKPHCGSGHFGKYHPGSSNMTLQEEQYELIKEGLQYDVE